MQTPRPRNRPRDRTTNFTERRNRQNSIHTKARFPNSRRRRWNRLCRLKRASRAERTTDAIEAILAIPWFPLNRLYRIKR